jgi:hypothetical protein
MNIPGFNATTSLGPAKGTYQANAVFGRSGGREVLPMLRRRPTFDNPSVCFGGAGESSCDGVICSCCYDDGCWICDDWSDFGEGLVANCVWDDKYSKGRAGGRLGTLSGVFTNVFERAHQLKLNEIVKRR